MRPQKKKHFYKGNTLSNWARAQLALTQFRGLFLHNRAFAPWGEQFVIFGLFCCCHTFPLKGTFLSCETGVGLEPAFRWALKRPLFWKKNVGPKPPVQRIYIYIYVQLYIYVYNYMYMCVWPYILWPYIYTHIDMYIDLCMYMYACIYLYIYIVTQRERERERERGERERQIM